MRDQCLEVTIWNFLASALFLGYNIILTLNEDIMWGDPPTKSNFIDEN